MAIYPCQWVVLNKWLKCKILVRITPNHLIGLLFPIKYYNVLWGIQFYSSDFLACMPPSGTNINFIHEVKYFINFPHEPSSKSITSSGGQYIHF